MKTASVSDNGMGNYHHYYPKRNVVCKFWKLGKCNRNPCGFMHAESLPLPPPRTNVYRRNSNPSSSSSSLVPCPATSSSSTATSCSVLSDDESEDRRQEELAKKNGPLQESRTIRVCKNWLSSGTCTRGLTCGFLHSWCSADGVSMVARLSGRDEAVSGIALPLGSDKLFSSSIDGSLRIWDCHSGRCVNVINLGDKIWSLITQGPWMFACMRNVVKAWNFETTTEFSLDGPTGHVYAMVVAGDMLFAAAQDGAILVWRGSTGTPNPFQLAATLKGHTGAVICLAVKDNRLFSGSMDSTIAVWDLDTLQCISTLRGHNEGVMSLVFWQHYLLSSSLD
ncbi:hypothetical protein Tsubulata_028014 [Turnera subulata]|uniref:C3H1-type domain-containing protein n=2 Tax=Turnera subulata TaxID=218843 RepID=A0A9Q0GAS8_9ROSI|nr:hypothetical protein Tsubulata_028014 [Turnera subulata]